MKKKWDKIYWINITHEKVDIYHTIFSNKDHVNIKNIFRKPLNIGLKVPLIFFHHISKWVNNAHLYHLYTLDFWEETLLFKISWVLPQRMGHLQIFPNIWVKHRFFFLISKCVNKFYPIHATPVGWKPFTSST